MDSLFVFCFKSCLKGDHDTEYYDVLQIDNSSLASTDLIKKQYKRLSLELHPDKLAQRGVEVTPEQKQRFLRVKEAYDVLSDPRRRRLYDQLGASGLKIIEHPTEVDPLTILRNYQKNGKERVLVFLLVACAFASLLVLPVLFSLKCDGTMGSDSLWVAIWTPMWIVDLFQLLSAVLYVLLSSEPESSNEEDSPTPAQRVPLVDRLNHLSITVLFVLVQIFVLIRLDRVVTWSWFVTFIPWFLYEMLSVANEFQLAVMTTIARPDFESSIGLMEDGPVGEEELFMLKVELENKHFEQVLLQQDARKHVIISMLRLWLAVFLALQLDHTVNWNWGVVLLPVWVYLFVQFGMAMSYRSWGHRKMAGIDEEAVAHGEEKDPIKVVSFQQGSQLSSTSLLICLAQCGPLFMAVLLVCRLQTTSSHFTTFIILLPIFAFIGCCCCAVFCGICCLSCVDMDGLAEPPAGSSDSSSPDRYSPPEPLSDVVTLGEVSLKESLPSHASSEGSAVHAKASCSTQIDVDID